MASIAKLSARTFQQIISRFRGYWQGIKYKNEPGQINVYFWKGYRFIQS